MIFKHTLIVGALFGIATLTAQAETVSINQNGSLVEMCASAEKQVATRCRLPTKLMPPWRKR